MNAMSIRVLPVGTALPGPPVATATLARHLGLAAEPARRLGDTLGIRSRHLCRDLDGGPPHATLADLATTAAGQAMAEAGVTCGEIGGVVMSTATPDSLMPATVNLVADRLGIDHVPSYQIQAGATGALQAIGVAAQMVSTGRRHTVLVLAGDVSTKQLEIPAASGAASERSALDAASFGDAAAAVVVTTLDRPGAYLLQRLVMRRGTAGLPPGYTADWHGVAERGSPGPVVAYDRDIIAEAVPKLAGDLLGDLLDGVGWRCADLARLLPPQLPGGLAGITARHLAVAADRCDSVVEEIGHAANSLPLFQLAHAYRRSGPGDPVAGVAVDPSDWSAAGVALQRI